MEEKANNIETRHGYTTGDIVYVVPTDYNKALNGVLKSFQKVGDFLPIIECDHPFKKGEKFKSAYFLNRISKTKTVSVIELKYVTVDYTYDGK